SGAASRILCPIEIADRCYKSATDPATTSTSSAAQRVTLEATFVGWDEDEPDPADFCMADVPALDSNEFRVAQADDAQLTQLRDWIEKNYTPTEDELAACPSVLKILQRESEHPFIQDDLLVWHEPFPDCPRRILVPNSLVEQVIADSHDGTSAAHEGVEKTDTRLCRYFYWPGMRSDIKLYIAASPACDKFRNAPRNARSPLTPIRAANRAELVAMYVVDGKEALLETERHHRHILTIIDVFTKYVVAVPLTNQLETTVSEASLRRWVLVFGAPMRLLTDRGLNFESAALETSQTDQLRRRGLLVPSQAATPIPARFGMEGRTFVGPCQTPTPSILSVLPNSFALGMGVGSATPSIPSASVLDATLPSPSGRGPLRPSSPFGAASMQVGEANDQYGPLQGQPRALDPHGQTTSLDAEVPALFYSQVDCSRDERVAFALPLPAHQHLSSHLHVAATDDASQRCVNQTELMLPRHRSASTSAAGANMTAGLAWPAPAPTEEVPVADDTQTGGDGNDIAQPNEARAITNATVRAVSTSQDSAPIVCTPMSTAAMQKPQMQSVTTPTAPPRAIVMGPPSAPAPRATPTTTSSATRVAARPRQTLAERYGVPEQDVRLVQGGRLSFIHRRTGTFHEWSPEISEWVTRFGLIYLDFDTPEDDDDTLVYDAAHPRVHMAPPALASALTPEMFEIRHFLDLREPATEYTRETARESARTIPRETPRETPMEPVRETPGGAPRSPPRPDSLFQSAIRAIKPDGEDLAGSPSKRRREGKSHEAYIDMMKQTPSRSLLVEYDRFDDPAYRKELQDRLGSFGPGVGLAVSVTRPELARALQHAQRIRETSTTTTSRVESLEEVLHRFREDERLASGREREDERHASEREREDEPKHFDHQMEVLHQQLEKAVADRERDRARGQGLNLTEFADRQASAAQQERLRAADAAARTAQQEAATTQSSCSVQVIDRHFREHFREPPDAADPHSVVKRKKIGERRSDESATKPKAPERAATKRQPRSPKARIQRDEKRRLSSSLLTPEEVGASASGVQRPQSATSQTRAAAKVAELKSAEALAATRIRVSSAGLEQCDDWKKMPEADARAADQELEIAPARGQRALELERAGPMRDDAQQLVVGRQCSSTRSRSAAAKLSKEEKGIAETASSPRSCDGVETERDKDNDRRANRRERVGVTTEVEVDLTSEAQLEEEVADTSIEGAADWSLAGRLLLARSQPLPFGTAPHPPSSVNTSATAPAPGTAARSANVGRLLPIPDVGSLARVADVDNATASAPQNVIQPSAESSSLSSTTGNSRAGQAQTLRCSPKPRWKLRRRLKRSRTLQGRSKQRRTPRRRAKRTWRRAHPRRRRHRARKRHRKRRRCRVCELVRPRGLRVLLQWQTRPVGADTVTAQGADTDTGTGNGGDGRNAVMGAGVGGA
ncbi:MAG: hypothetical protein FD144_5913, partial [Rhodospirillaceae bacterium]